jgi:hypothetical protein
MSTGAPPRVLLATTCRWIATARLAAALARAGCEVSVACPRDHPATKVRGVRTVHPYRALAPLRSLGAALDAARPDLIVPCDDLATAHLHRLHDLADGPGPLALARRLAIEHALGDPASFGMIASRAALMGFARERGVRVPATAPVSSVSDLHAWLASHGLPAVLKADGTYGGRGVRIVSTEAEATEAFHALTAPPSPMTALRRALVNRDLTYVAPCAFRRGSSVSVQRFVAGQDANATVMCWQGEVRALIVVSVVQTCGPHGPASVVRVLEHAEIADAVHHLVRELKLSGLIGCDFILDEATGTAHLIELNPRATQMAHMDLGQGRDLPGALRAVLSGEPVRDGIAGPAEGSLIALFPQEWLRDPASVFLESARVDIPWGEPDLLRASLEDDVRSRRWSRLTSSLRSLGGRGQRAASERNA